MIRKLLMEGMFWVDLMASVQLRERSQLGVETDQRSVNRTVAPHIAQVCDYGQTYPKA